MKNIFFLIIMLFQLGIYAQSNDSVNVAELYHKTWELDMSKSYTDIILDFKKLYFEDYCIFIGTVKYRGIYVWKDAKKYEMEVFGRQSMAGPMGIFTIIKFNKITSTEMVMTIGENTYYYTLAPDKKKK